MHTEFTMYETQQQIFLTSVVIRACKTTGISFLSSVHPHAVQAQCCLNCPTLPVISDVIITGKNKKIYMN